VLEELHAQRNAVVHPAPGDHGTSAAGRSQNLGVSLLLLGVHEEPWYDETKRRVGNSAACVFKEAQHLRVCQHDVFSDVEVEVGPGLKTIMVKDVDSDFHFAKRKSTGAWVNTGMFTQVWKAIANGGKYKSSNWVVKVDADAVFVPSRLEKKLQYQLVPASGIYLENCKFVDYGYFGNLEVYSRVAFSSLLENIDACKASREINWKVGIKDGKYGPMGEDLFAQACLDKLGVRRVEAFDITTDGACPADRPADQQKNKKWKPDCAVTSTAAMHPFKKKAEWVKCHDATIAAYWY